MTAERTDRRIHGISGDGGGKPPSLRKQTEGEADREGIDMTDVTSPPSVTPPREGDHLGVAGGA